MPITIPPMYPNIHSVVFWDDFIGALYSNRIWAVTGTGSVAITDAVGGIALITANASSTYRFNHNNRGAFSVANTVTAHWRGSMTLPTAGTGGSVECGLQDTVAPTTTLICIQALRGTNNWQCITSNAGTATITDSNIAVDTNSHEFVVEGTSSLVNFYIDGVRCATNTTNIPLDRLQPYVNCAGSTSTGAAVSRFYANSILVIGGRA